MMTLAACPAVAATEKMATVSRSLPVAMTPDAGQLLSRLAPSSRMKSGSGGHIGGHRPALQHAEALVLDRLEGALDLEHLPEDDAGVAPQADRLVERGGAKVDVEGARGIGGMSGEVPVANVEEVEAAQLDPGGPVVGSGREILAQHLGADAPLPVPGQFGGARRDRGVERRLTRKGSRPCQAHEAQRQDDPPLGLRRSYHASRQSGSWIGG